MMVRSLYLKLLISVLLTLTGPILIMFWMYNGAFEEQQRHEQEDILQENMARLFTAQLLEHASESLWQTAHQLPTNRLDKDVSLLVCNSRGLPVLSLARFSSPALQAASLCADRVPRLSALSSTHSLGQTAPRHEPYDFVYSQRIGNNKPETETYYFMLIKPAQAYEQLIGRNRQLSRKRALALFFIMAIILVGSTHWSLGSLKRLRREIAAIQDGRQESLQQNYEIELDSLTVSLNQLLANERNQRKRYQQGMDDLAHSLKTRLSLIHASMQEANLSQRERERLNEQVVHMDQIVQYHLRRAVTGRQSLTRQAVDPVPLIQSLLATLGKVYRHKSLRVKQRCDESLQFIGNSGDLVELLGNLLDNAFKFAISTIEVYLYRDGNQLVLRIEDDGPGIVASQRQRVLQRGVRADNSGGQGIGLSLSAEIIDSYQGTLSIKESHLGGTAVSVRLPSH